MIWLIIHIIDILAWLLLAASTLYILFFALVSTLWKKRVNEFTLFLTGKKSTSHTWCYTLPTMKTVSSFLLFEHFLGNTILTMHSM